MTTAINRSHGICLCWRCKGLTPSAREQQWLANVLAKQLLRMPLARRVEWLANYFHRHGADATAELRRVMDAEQRFAPGCQPTRKDIPAGA